MVKRVISRECGNSWTGLTLYLFLPFLPVFPLFLSCFCRLWGSVRRWRPAVKNGLILTPSTLLFVQPPTPVYATHRHAEIKSLFFAKNSSWWTRCVWILRIPHIPASEQIMSMVLGAVVFQSARRLDCRFAGRAKHLLANVNYTRDTVSAWPLGRDGTGRQLQKHVEKPKSPLLWCS